MNCGKALTKIVRRIYVPFDCEDVPLYIEEQLDANVQIMDAAKTIAKRQVEYRGRFDDRMERAKEAQHRQLLRHNEPDDPTNLKDRMNVYHDADWAKEPEPDQYKVPVRVWRGDYGYDGSGLFHSGECARQWATVIARTVIKDHDGIATIDLRDKM